MVGIKVDRDGDHFHYFECLARRMGEVDYSDRLLLVRAAVDAVSDRVAAGIRPLDNPSVAITVPIDAHTGISMVTATIATAAFEIDQIQHLPRLLDFRSCARGPL